MRGLALSVSLLFLGLACVERASCEERTRALEGKRFRVVVHGAVPEETGRRALESVESIWPLAAGLYGLDAVPADQTPVVHLYATAAAYAEADQRLTGGRFRRNLAFADPGTITAHVALQPEVGPAVLKEVGLPYLTENLLAHEAAHLVRYLATPGASRAPGWFADGAGMWVKHKAEVDRGRVADLGSNPTSATLIRRVQRLAETGRLPSIAAILQDETDDLSFYERYGTRWLLFRFLAEGPWRARLPRIVAAVVSTDDDRGGAGLGRESVPSILGEPGLDRVDAAFRRDLASLDPAWHEAFRSLDTGGAVPWTQVAFPDTNALAWRLRPAGAPPWTLAGEVRRLPGRGRQMNLLLDRQGDDFLSVALHADGHVTLFHYDAGTRRWARLAHASAAALSGDAFVAFRVHADPARLRIDVGGREVLRLDLPGRALDGPWGVGAQSGTAGRWKDVRLEPRAGDGRR